MSGSERPTVSSVEAPEATLGATPGGVAGHADAPRRPLPPLWAVELLDVLGRRGGFAVAVASVLSGLALVVTLALPDLLTPDALLGAAAGGVALVVGVALALALDALDVRVRGPRHVRSSTGELVALLPDDASPRDADDLADAVRAVRTAGSTLHLGLAPVGEDVTSSVAWARALAESIADAGSSVLLIDVATGTTDAPGVLEVVRDRVPLSDVVTYVDGRSLALAGPGADRGQALQALVTLPTVLPADVDVLLVALPPVVTRTAVNASRVLDQVLFVAEANLTSRVELMASLDALRVAGCAPQVVLVDGATYATLRPERAPTHRRMTTRIDPVPLAGAVVAADPPVAEPAAAPAPEPAAALQPEPVTVPEPEPEPAPVLEPEPEPLPVPEPPRSAGEPSSPLRTVEVLEAAASARAQSTLDAANVDTVPLERADVLPPEPSAPAPPEPAPPPAPAAPAPAPAPAASVDPADKERTTELPFDRGPTPAWASPDEEEDLLRTTVQMSVFSEELELRDED